MKESFNVVSKIMAALDLNYTMSSRLLGSMLGKLGR